MRQIMSVRRPSGRHTRLRSRRSQRRRVKVTKAILQAAQSATKDRSADEPELFTRLFKVGETQKPKKINHGGTVLS